MDGLGTHGVPEPGPSRAAPLSAPGRWSADRARSGARGPTVVTVELAADPDVAAPWARPALAAVRERPTRVRATAAPVLVSTRRRTRRSSTFQHDRVAAWLDSHLPTKLPFRRERYFAAENDPLVQRARRVVRGHRAYQRDRTLRGKAKTPIHTLVEWTLLLAVALTVTGLVRSTVVETFHIPSESMVPTLQVGDRVAVNRLAYRFGPPARGDVVVFAAPASLRATAPDTEHLVKRIVGLPGDRIAGRDGRVWVNGQVLAEPYLPAGMTTSAFGPVRVPPDRYFMMGDNRPNSEDSRFIGTIGRDAFVGAVVWRFWPLPRTGTVR